MILLENTGFFKNKADALADYMGSLPDYLVLIFVEEEVDKRNRMYKAVQKQGRAVEFARQDEKTLMTWVLGMMKKRGKKDHAPGYGRFSGKDGRGYGKYLAGAGKTAQLYDGKRCDHAGGYRGSLHNADYEPDFRDDPRGNGEEAAESARSVSGSAGFKGAADADSLSAGTPVQSATAGQRAAGRALRSGDDRKTDGLQSFVVRNYIPMSRQYAAEELKAAVNDCVQMEEDVKTGKISDLLSVELLITKYSRAA